MSAAATEPITAKQLRHALGHYPTGVTIVTSLDQEGVPVGTTVSAVSSLSVDPPLVLVCLARGSSTLQAIRERRGFAVNVLADGQDELSSNFARPGAVASWDGIAHGRWPSGNPQLRGVLAALDCEVEQLLAGGDHEIVIGRVRELQVAAGQQPGPLVHWRGAYARLAPGTERHRPGTPRAVEFEAVECALPTPAGSFRAIGFEHDPGGDELIALVHGNPVDAPRVPVHSHVHCLFGDAFGSTACDCRASRERATEAIIEAGAGVILYTKAARADGFGCPRGHRVDASVAAGLLRHVGVRQLALTGGDPQLERELAAAGFELVGAGGLRAAA